MNIFAEIKNNPKYKPENSWQWYQTNVRQLTSSKVLSQRPMQMLTDNQPQLTTKLFVDGAYQFFYDPKTKDKLPYWDTFPLIIPFDKDAESFIGINWHYLPIKTRFVLFRKMMAIINMPNRDDKTKLKLKWQLINSSSKFPEVAPAVKRYLINHVKSRFLKISHSDLEIAIALPTERFKGATAEQVWEDSRRQIGR